MTHMANEIRHLAISMENSILAAAEFESAVSIWDIQFAKRIINISTILDFGGRRLLLGQNGQLCITASYNKGIAAYNINDGNIAWHRKDLKKIQFMDLSTDEKFINCRIDSAHCKIIETLTGETIEPSPHYKYIWESKSQPVKFLQHRKNVFILKYNEVHKATIRLNSFAHLALAFGYDRFCISESGGPVRCFFFANGVEIWRYDPPINNHILDMIYDADANSFYGMEWSYTEGGPLRLIYFDANSGESHIICNTGPSTTFQFSNDGKYIIISDGKLRRTCDGSVIKIFPF